MASTITPKTTQPENDHVQDALPELPKRVAQRNRPQNVQPVPIEKAKDPWLSLAALVVLGGISGAAYYLGFVKPYLLSDYFATPLQDLAKINQHTPLSANQWGFTWLVAFACYYAAFRICPPAGNITRAFKLVALVLIGGMAAFFALNLLFMYPVGAADLFDQIFRARLTAHYGLNPFTTLPGTVIGDPLRNYVAWQGDPSPYGPVWETLAAGASLLAGDNLWGNLIIFKLLVVSAYGVGVAFSYGILRSIKPEWAFRGMLLFAWNPLVLFEVAGNGHNDAVVIMFVLAGVFFFVRAKQIAVIPALVLGALTKFVPVLLIPTAIAALWRDRVPARTSSKKQATENGMEELPQATTRSPLKTIAWGIGLSIGIGAIFYAPFWTGVDGLLPKNRGTLFTASIPKVILDTLITDMRVAESQAQWLVRNTAYGIVGLVAIGLAFWVWRAADATTPEKREILVNRTLRAFYEIIFVYLVVASLWFQPWYLLWLIALTVPLAAQHRYVVRTLLFCIGGVLNYFVWDFLWLWNHADSRTIQTTAALAVYTLPVLYTLWVWFQEIPMLKPDITNRSNYELHPMNYELPKRKRST